MDDMSGFWGYALIFLAIFIGTSGKWGDIEAAIARAWHWVIRLGRRA